MESSRCWATMYKRCSSCISSKWFMVVIVAHKTWRGDRDGDGRRYDINNIRISKTKWMFRMGKTRNDELECVRPDYWKMWLIFYVLNQSYLLDEVSGGCAWSIWTSSLSKAIRGNLQTMHVTDLVSHEAKTSSKPILTISIGSNRIESVSIGSSIRSSYCPVPFPARFPNLQAAPKAWGVALEVAQLVAVGVRLCCRHDHESIACSNVSWPDSDYSDWHSAHQNLTVESGQHQTCREKSEMSPSPHWHWILFMALYHVLLYINLIYIYTFIFIYIIYIYIYVYYIYVYILYICIYIIYMYIYYIYVYIYICILVIPLA